MYISGLDANGQNFPDAAQIGAGRSPQADALLFPFNSLNGSGQRFNAPGAALDPDQAQALQSWLAIPKAGAIAPPAAEAFSHKGSGSAENASQMARQRRGDRLVGTRGDDVLRGRSGDEVLLGQGGHDRLLGKGGDDRLLGRGGRDQLLGGRGDDQLAGGNGADQLTGGAGQDTLTGGGGRDTFILQTGGGRSLRQADVITDFRDGVDQFRLEDIEFSNVEIVQGSGRYSEDTVMRDRTTGKPLVILQKMTSDRITAEDVVTETTNGPGDGSADNPTGEPPPSDPPTSEPPTDGNPTDGSPTDGSPTDGNPTDGNPTDGTPPSEPPTDPSPIPNPPPDDSPLLPGAIASVGQGLNFSGANLADEAAVRAIGSPTITVGDRTVYIGYRQVSSTNQNPIVVSFNSKDPSQNWSRTDYEVTGADSRGYGLFWSGTDLYGVFSIDGAQGQSSEDFRRASGNATQSWLRSYGSGGGPKIAVIARLDLETGNLLDAAHLSALLSSGKSNSLVIEALEVNASGNLVIRAQSYFSPRRPDGKAMTQISSGSSPFDYTVEITPDLKRVVSTAAVGWTQ
ncbi:MAG: hypothetical protein VKK04_09935 [Synechococcales bacterium]|nr:hypothetical protein [Synechococcales bacterium]